MLPQHGLSQHPPLAPPPSQQNFPAGQPLPRQQVPPLHGVPSAFCEFEQMPDDESQVPALWHWSSAVQIMGLLPDADIGLAGVGLQTAVPALWRRSCAAGGDGRIVRRRPPPVAHRRIAMPSSTIPASHRDLLDTNQVVVLATNGTDGFPQVTATWFLAEEDGTVKLSLNTARQKTKNLLRDPRATLFFFDPANPYRTLEIRARAEVTPDPDYAFADRFAGRYGGADLRQNDRPGESRVVVSFIPVKVNTFG